MRHRKLSDAEKRATETLVHYFKTTWERIGLQWRPDNTKEIEGIITDVVDAAIEEAK